MAVNEKVLEQRIAGLEKEFQDFLKNVRKNSDEMLKLTESIRNLRAEVEGLKVQAAKDIQRRANEEQNRPVGVGVRQGTVGTKY